MNHEQNGPKVLEDEFTSEQLAQVDAIIEKHKQKPGALIPVLEEVQGVTGYLPGVIQRRVAKGLGIPLAQVYGVVTFYSFFTMVPRGKNQIRVCLGTACHVRGGQRIMDTLTEQLGVGAGQCTPDRKFSLDVVRCLGCCALAPVMVVNDKVHKQIKTAQLSQIMKAYD